MGNTSDNNVRTISNLLNLLDGKLPRELLQQLNKCVSDYDQKCPLHLKN